MSSSKKILFWTGRGAGFGNGHWVRVQRLAALLKKERPEWQVRTSLDEPKVFLKECAGFSPDLAVIDRRESHSEIIGILKKANTPVAVFDSRSPERNDADYVIEAFPSLEDRPARANLIGVSWLPPLEVASSLPEALPWKNPNSFRILFYLGGVEDRQVMDLMRASLLAWLEAGAANEIRETGKSPVEILEVTQDLQVAKSVSSPELGISHRQIGFREDFSTLQASCDLFCGYFGTSLFEALSLERNVLVLNPSSYHGALAAKHLEGLVFSRSDKELRSLAEIKRASAENAEKFQLGRSFHLFPKILEALMESGARASLCRACGSKSSGVVSRRKQANLIKCASCGLVWMREFLSLSAFEDPNDPAHGSNIYGSEYFVEEYVKTYGKTYEEDRANIHRYSDERLSRITKLRKNGRLLDIGAAMGFFLDRALSLGFETWGIELSDFAAGKADPRHRMLQGDFRKIDLGASFDVVTLWYVIEHFRDIDAVIEKIAALQGRGAVLAMSTPKADGFSGRFESAKFLAGSAEDHYFIYSPKSLAKILEPYGYRLRQVWTSGIHHSRFQKRFPALARFIPPKIYAWLAQKLGWGDTFEAYFVKIS